MLSSHPDAIVISHLQRLEMKIPKHKAFRLMLSGNNTIIGAAPMEPTPAELKEKGKSVTHEKDLHPKDAEPPFPTNTSIGYYIAAILTRPTTLEAWMQAVSESDTWFEASWKMVNEYGGIQLNPDPEQIREKRVEEVKDKLNMLKATSHLNKGEA